ncbi:MAG TPA: peptide chain release factor N(5)-glutamine methyltransferase [Vicinamibacterales bacterium]|nr:peptide chain release factor N(5)-glutamine methyltransferase [Vicinamibacterales bacterium]
MHSLHEALATARAQLVSAGIAPAEAAVDVPLFACTILGWDRARLLAEKAASPPASLEPQLSEWIARRIAREPAAYIVGAREFWGLDFGVSPAVLIPRPESEFIVEEALAILQAMDVTSPWLADVGTGSGNLAISMAHELPQCQITATDVSADALHVARANARRHGVDDRITFVETSYLDGVEDVFDLIMANPPYVKEGDKPALTRGVRHEPEVALFGGASGLRGLQAVLDAAITKLQPGGWLVMEFGYGQEDELRILVSARPTLRVERVREDLQGIPRTAIIQRGD